MILNDLGIRLGSRKQGSVSEFLIKSRRIFFEAGVSLSPLLSATSVGNGWVRGGLVLLDGVGKSVVRNSWLSRDEGVLNKDAMLNSESAR